MTNKKTIVFDFFGVICSRIAPPWFEKHFSDQDTEALKEGYFGPADIGEVSDKELLKQLSGLANQTPEEIESEWFSMIEIDREVISIIENLRKSGYEIHIGSNVIKNLVQKITAKENLDYLFDSRIISSEIGLMKPDPLFFKKMLELIDKKPEEVIFIDDSQNNVDSAKEIGIESYIFKDISDLNFLKK